MSTPTCDNLYPTLCQLSMTMTRYDNQREKDAGGQNSGLTDHEMGPSTPPDTVITDQARDVNAGEEITNTNESANQFMQ